MIYIQEVISKLDPEITMTMGKPQSIIQNETLKNNKISFQ